MNARRAGLLACVLVFASCARTAPRAMPDAESARPYERAWPVMGTMLRVLVWDDADAAAVQARVVRGEVSRLDSLLSNYRDDSDVSAVNRAAGSGSWVPVARATADALAAALAYARQTGGAFDPTVGPVVDVWGFYRESGAMPSAAAIDSARALVGWQRVELDSAGSRVRIARGMRLDFGAIGKGFAVDRALAEARAAGATRLMVDLGGNIGVLGAAPTGGRWPIGLRHPRDPDVPFAVIDVPDGSVVATSGDYERYFVHEGIRYAHIIDPRHGRPVQGVASVSVLAPTGTASDGLSTSLFVLGVERGCAFIADLEGVGAIWVLPPDAEDDVLRTVVGGAEADRIAVGSNVDVRRCEDAVR